MQPGNALTKALEIIEETQKDGYIAVIVSALGNSTDRLLELYEKTIRFDDIASDLEEFRNLQASAGSHVDLSSLYEDLEKSL